MTRREAEDLLREAARSRKVSHAYILQSADRAERNALAEVLVSGLQRRRTNNPDVIRVTHEKPTLISVGEIRSQLVSDMAIRPYEEEHKIYLVDDADLMNEAAQNALLKTLEEPPEYGVILLLLANAEKLLPTIRSRAVLVSVSEEIRSDLSGEDRELFFRILRNVPERTAAGIGADVKTLQDLGKNDKGIYAAFIACARLWCRDLLVTRLTGGKAALYYPELAADYEKAAPKYSIRRLSDAEKAVGLAEERLAASVNTETLLRVMLCDMRRQTEENV